MKSASVTSYAHPIIEDLARRHDEAVYMTVINNGDVLFVDMVDCKHHVKATTFVGKRFPFFTNAAGKVMKALDSWDLLEKMLKKYRPLNAVPNLDELKSELCEIRLNGVAIDREALGEGIISVAVAVRDYAGKVVGAITLLGPSFRMLSERLESEIIPSLLEGAELLSAKYGYAPAK
jgi:DNA-binding IclR family transcriptional regulator